MSENITSVSREDRIFPPSSSFSSQANLSSMEEYQRLYRQSIDEPEAFWSKQAERFLTWRKRWDRVRDGEVPHPRWFEGGTLNVAENCLDRHLGTPREDKVAILFEGEPGDVKTLTYRQLYEEVARCANVLSSFGVEAGDRVAIYLPMVPEAAVAMLACARIGAIHTVIFGGFSKEAIKDRVNDCQAKLIITADGGYRRGQTIALKEAVDAAVRETPSVEKVLVM